MIFINKLGARCNIFIEIYSLLKVSIVSGIIDH